MVSVHLLRLLSLLYLVPNFRSAAIPTSDQRRISEIYRKEVIKATILDKLGLSREPDQFYSRPLTARGMPPPLRRLYQRRTRPARPVRPGQFPRATVYKMIVFPSTDPVSNSTDHLRFKLPSTAGNRVLSASLSAYHGLPNWRELPSKAEDKVRRDLPFSESLKDYSKVPSSLLVHLEQRAIFGNPGHEKVIRVGSKWVDFRLPGWAEFDVTELTNFWLGSPERNGGLDIRCLTCRKYMKSAPFYTDPDQTTEGASNRPFMVLTLQELDEDELEEGSGALRHQPEPLRHKRDVTKDCDEEEEEEDDDAFLTSRNETSPLPRSCCRRSLIVSFKDIGWDGWVMEPEEFDAHYCLGQCASYNLPGPHAAIMDHVVSPVYQMKPCCVPVPGQMRDLLIRYSFDGGKTISTQLVPNIIVNSCGCL
ncbi:inhibin beta B chain-like isoform X2 [Branchiostoma floridae x Branchiostoma belcheri]